MLGLLHKHPTRNSGGGESAGLSFWQDFANASSMADAARIGPVLDHSRGTNATMFDNTGTLVFAPHNLILQSEDLETTWTESLVTVTAGAAANPINGAIDAFQIDFTADTSAELFQSTTGSTVADTEYTFAVWLQVASGTEDIEIEFWDAGVGSQRAVKTVTTTWQQFSHTATYGNGAGRVISIENSSADVRTVYVYRPQLNRGSSVLDYNLTTTSAFYGPRFDHSPVSPFTSRGLLIEEAGTNICLQSEAISTSPWIISAGNTTITANVGVAPDGNTTADDMLHHDNNENQIQSITAVDGAIYTISAFVKQGLTGSHDWVRMIWIDDSDRTNGFDAFFDLTTGNTGELDLQGVGGTAISSSMTDVGDGVFHIVMTGKIVAGQTDALFAFVNSENDGAANEEATNSVLWWGLEVKLGSFLDSYIPTTTAAVTRAADVVSGDISAIVTPAMTLFFEGRTGFDAGVCMQLDDGTEDERFRLERNSSNEIHFIVTDGGTGLVDLNLGTVADNTDFKACISFALNNVKGIITGGTEQTDTGVTMPTVDTIRYGMDTSGDEFNAWIKEGKLWNVNKDSAFIAAQVA